MMRSVSASPQPAGSYRAYGLAISSHVPLPGLTWVPGAGAVDLEICDAAGAHVRDLDGNASARTSDAQRVRLVWPGVGRAVIESGRLVIVRRDPDGNEATLGACLAGSALAIALFQRGHLVLHASAVSFGDRIAAFAGPSGTGKSTLAAACVTRGARLVTDDVVCLEPSTVPPLVRSAYPGMRLDEPASAMLGPGAAVVARASSGDNDKDVFGVADRFETQAKPLRAVFLVEDGEDLAIVRRPPQQAAIDLVFNSYVATLLTGRTEADHFVRCADLATRIAVFTLRRPRRLGDLGAVVSAVEVSLAGLEGTH